ISSAFFSWVTSAHKKPSGCRKCLLCGSPTTLCLLQVYLPSDPSFYRQKSPFCTQSADGGGKSGPVSAFSPGFTCSVLLHLPHTLMGKGMWRVCADGKYERRSQGWKPFKNPLSNGARSSPPLIPSSTQWRYFIRLRACCLLTGCD